MSRLPSWAVSDAFWQRIRASLTVPTGTRVNLIAGEKSVADSRWIIARCLKVLFMFCAPGVQWNALPKEVYDSPSSIHGLLSPVGEGRGMYEPYGEPGWRNTLKWSGISSLWQSIYVAMSKAPLVQEHRWFRILPASREENRSITSGS